MAKEFKITSIRLQELEEELHYLKTTREKEVAEHLKEARSFGDLSENSEYDEAKNEQAQLYGRIAEVENILAHAVIIDDGLDGVEESVHGRVGLGCTVKVLDIEFDEEDIYAIVGSQEADPKNHRISDDSPFGRAMIGKTVGDTVEVEAPVGVVRFKILSVEK
ncbi:MAG: transcription elongation factor GreA [Oscillospiraceae bacterium]|nr:transcription elongation factor GreA [Oscillospiraceae bacterium]MBR7010246.1 transcription elongation factor GreA [Oscillospiraceae bacterium]